MYKLYLHSARIHLTKRNILWGKNKWEHMSFFDIDFSSYSIETAKKKNQIHKIIIRIQKPKLKKKTITKHLRWKGFLLNKGPTVCCAKCLPFHGKKNPFLFYSCVCKTSRNIFILDATIFKSHRANLS